MSLTNRKKEKQPVCSLEDRMAVFESLRCVDEVFVEHALELKAQYIQEQAADIMVMGEDWRVNLTIWAHCEVVYLERTPSISTTALLELSPQTLVVDDYPLTTILEHDEVFV